MKKPCRISGKVKFDTHEQAAARAGEILEKSDSSIKELTTYLCSHCNKWHLTNPAKRVWKKKCRAVNHDL